MTCDVCHRVVLIESCTRRSNDPGDHDPAYHVAKAYHYETSGHCASCGEPFPCTTRVEFA